MSTKRSPNFKQEEKLLLINLIWAHRSVIENKRTDSVSTRQKNAAWEKIEGVFNIVSSNKRKAATLKMCWENLKKRRKKYFNELKSEMRKTDGGSKQLSKDVFEKVSTIVSPSSFVGMNSDGDSDVDYFSRELSMEEPNTASAHLMQEPPAQLEESNADEKIKPEQIQPTAAVKENNVNMQHKPTMLSGEQVSCSKWNQKLLRTSVKENTLVRLKIELDTLAKKEAESRLALLEIEKNTEVKQAQASNTLCKLQIKQEESMFAFLQEEAKEKIEIVKFKKEEARERVELVEHQKKETKERLDLAILQKEESKKKLEQEEVKLAILKVQLQRELKDLKNDYCK